MTPTEEAAKLAVEEMAEKLFRMGYAKTPMTLKTAIVEELTPLYAKLAEYAEVLGECRVCVECLKIMVESFTYPPEGTRGAELRKRNVKEYETLRNRIDALLGAKGGDDAR